MSVDRYITMIQQGEAPQPLVLSRRDIEWLVGRVFGIELSYSELATFAHRDFLFVSPEKDGLSVDEARRLISAVSFANSDSVRIVVIDRFDQASGEACNALLKILEDGIPGVLFILQATSFVGLMETILSRVVPVSCDSSEIQATEADLRLVRGILAHDAPSLRTYVQRKFATREEALVFLQSAKEVCIEQGALDSLDEIAEVCLLVASTNAQPKYLVDRVFLRLIRR